MFGLGRKKLQLSDAVKAFFEHVVREAHGSLPAIREAINYEARYWDGEPEAIDGDQLLAEILLAGLAIGLQSVRNIWDADTFDRARREVIRIIEGLGEPEVTYYHKLHLDEYLSPWRGDLSTALNTPWDDIAARVLSNIGVEPTLDDTPIINPAVIMGVSSVLLRVPGMFWKNVENEFKLS